MKKIIKKFWGVALVVVLLSTLFVGTVPQASAATLAWSTTGAGLGAFGQIAPATDASIVKVAPNGHIFVVDKELLPPGPDRILKSIDGGHTWAAAAIAGLVAGDKITDIAISPYYETDGYVYAVVNIALAGPIARVYQSTNAGASFLQLGGNIGTATVEAGTSIALDPTFHTGVGQIMVGTVDIGAGTVAGNVYIWGAPALTWTPQTAAPNLLPAADYTAVAFSPAFQIDQTIFAIGSVAGGTSAHIKVFTNAWDIAAYYLVSPIVVGATDFGTAVTGIRSSVMAFPANFDASSLLTDTFYVGINSLLAAANDVYRVNLNPLLAATVAPILYAGVGGTAIRSLAYQGTAAAGTLYAGGVAAATYWSNAAAGVVALAPFSWLPGGALTGAANASVAVSPTFTTDATLYVGTTGLESALNVSTNAGLSFQQAGLIDTGIASIQDFVPYSATEWYEVTNTGDAEYGGVAAIDGGAGITAGADAVADVFAVDYINQNGVARTVVGLDNGTITIPALGLAAGGIVQMALFPGDTGVQSITLVARAVTVPVNDCGVAAETIGFFGNTTATAFGVYTLANPPGAGAFAVGAAVAISPESLWKTTDGLTWERINVLLTTTDTAAVRLSPTLGADGTMYFYEVGVTAAAPLLRMSQDSGVTWTARFFSPALSVATSGVGDVVVVDALTLYAGDAGTGTVYKTGNNGFWWTAQALPLAAGNVFQFRRDAGTGHMLAGTTAGEIYRSTDGLTWTLAGIALVGGNMVVAFDSAYGTNSIIYAGDSSGALAGIHRYNFAAPLVGWTNILGTPLAGATQGIIITPDGALYAADATAATALGTAGGVWRILAPTTGIGIPFGPAAECVGVLDGLTLNDTVQSLAYVAGSNILYAIESTGADKIVTYTDTLTTAVPAIVSPADGDILFNANIFVTITPVTGATAHQIQWDTRADFLAAVGGAAYPIPAVINSVQLTLNGAGVVLPPAGVTIYYRVRVTAPVFGPWSQVYSLNTELVPLAPNAPAPAGPAAGGTVTGGYDAALQPTFQWGAVPGATAYEFVLAKDAALTVKVIDATGANALAVVTAYKLTGATLSYSTTYYWQVRAISGTSQTAWCNVQAFTTMDKPVEPTTIVIPTQEPAPVPTIILPTPNVTVTVPAATQAPDKVVNPTYIWAIIIIGAVLVIAVIVLIVRTRRSV